MRVVVIGGSGLIGSSVVARLAVAGHEVVGVGRSVAEAERRVPGLRWIRLDVAKAPPAAWSRAFEGAHAVVNCAGALQDNARDDLAGVHVEGLRRLAEGAIAAGVRRVVHISAAGVETSPGAFGATKRAGEAALAALDLDWIVLRPGLVLAPVAFGGSALLRALAAFPIVIPAVQAGSRVQVVAAEDVAEAVAVAVRPEAPTRIAVDLVAAEETSLGEILLALRGWLGLPGAPTLALPMGLARLAGRVADALAHLGWRSPMRTTTIAQLAAGVKGEAGAAERLLGVRMRSLGEILLARPAGVQERWFARLYLLKPLCLFTLAMFWLVSGLIGFTEPDRAAAILVAGGFGAGPAKAAVWLGSAADVVVGLLACHRASARSALLGMLAISASYVIGASIWRPDLWADPLGPMLKVLPCALLACVTLALLDER